MQVGLLIDNARVAAHGAGVSVRKNPVTGVDVTTFAAAKARDAIKAVESCAKAFPAWSKTSPAERAACFHRFGELLVEHREELGRADRQQPAVDDRAVGGRPRHRDVGRDRVGGVRGERRGGGRGDQEARDAGDDVGGQTFDGHRRQPFFSGEAAEPAGMAAAPWPDRTGLEMESGTGRGFSFSPRIGRITRK